MSDRKLDPTSIRLALATAVVGGLAAFGVFSMMTGFPLVFGAVCLVMGFASLWRNRGTVRVLASTVLLLVGAAVPVAGYLQHFRVVRASEARVQAHLAAELVGTPAPALVGLEPLNTGLDALAEASSYESAATLVTFWATWCSPCYAEMEELEELYRRHRDDGLSVVAITRYDEPGDSEDRRADREGSARFARRRGLTYPVAITGEADVYRGFRVDNVPRTALVDNQGTIVGYAVGLAGARDLMRQAAARVAAGRHPRR